MDWPGFLDGEIRKRDARQESLWKLFGYSVAFFGATSWFLLRTPQPPSDPRAWVVAVGLGGLLFALGLVQLLLRAFLRGVQPMASGATARGERMARFLAHWPARPGVMRDFPEALGALAAAGGCFALAATMAPDLPIELLYAYGVTLLAYAAWFVVRPGHLEAQERRQRQKPLAGWRARLRQSHAVDAFGGLYLLFLAASIGLGVFVAVTQANDPNKLLAQALGLGGAAAATFMALTALKLCFLLTMDHSRTALEQMRYALLSGEFPAADAEDAFALVERLGPQGRLRGEPMARLREALVAYRAWTPDDANAPAKPAETDAPGSA